MNSFDKYPKIEKQMCLVCYVKFKNSNNLKNKYKIDL